MLYRFLAAAALAGAGLLAALPAAQAAAAGNIARPEVHGPSGGSPSDGFFYTTYELNEQTLQWVTCGADSQSEGCFGSGQLGPFGRVCAVAGSAKQVLVADNKPDSGVTTIYVYRQVESATPSAKLVSTFELPAIPTSNKGQCHLAIGGDFAYFGTNQSSTYYQIDLRAKTLRPAGICGGNTSSITANDRFVVVSQSGCFEGFDLQGNSWEDGGEFTDTFVPGKNAYTP